jgi:hypothetical protein
MANQSVLSSISNALRCPSLPFPPGVRFIHVPRSALRVPRLLQGTLLQGTLLLLLLLLLFLLPRISRVAFD